MNTQNVKTAAQESSERWCETKLVTGDGSLTPDQVFDLYNFVVEHGQNTGSIGFPNIPEGSERFTVFYHLSPDSWGIWIHNGWPIAASDDMCSIYYVISQEEVK
jgi:hypothetical protein